MDGRSRTVIATWSKIPGRNGTLGVLWAVRGLDSTRERCRNEREHELGVRPQLAWAPTLCVRGRPPLGQGEHAPGWDTG